MSISRKPSDKPRAEPDQAAYEAYLHKGGSAAQAATDEPKDVRFTLQVPGRLCQQLDELRRRRPGKISRHQWVLEAIAQQIQREAQVETVS
jgi:hypothetical protein